tara:strand:- start:507 stop:638 length:132 start_codon:yes stop_codon:yes gene_type:complete
MLQHIFAGGRAFIGSPAAFMNRRCFEPRIGVGMVRADNIGDYI